MTESALVDTPAGAGFDAVLLTSAHAASRVGGMRLIERCAFAVARAGARRLLCIGRPPAGDLRLPDLDVTWLSDERDLAAWSAEAALPIVGLDASTVVDADTVGALLTATGAGPLSTPDGRLWRCQPATLPAVIAAARRGARADGLAGTHAWRRPADALLIPVVDRVDQARAEETLLDRLGRSDDAWLTRMVDRRASRVLTRRLMHTRVRPNQVTVLSIVVGITGGLAFTLGTYAATSVGALLFLLSTILDGCDGELARLTYRESRIGAHLDVIGDNVVHIVLFAGIAVGLYRVMPADHVVVLGAILLAGALAAMTSVYVNIVRRTPTTAQRALFETFAGREFSWLLAAMTLAGRLDLFLWAAAIGVNLFAAGIWLLGRWGRPTG